ncbi:N-acetylmuramoyl-L-alanine amidase [Streptomyces sp. NPDC048188]|uniref:N-acetylmuramoyl-L-alanine amidase n=1 Tax=Streptomyces sp. NPDC048188 TaxID=3155749 RepID=UPI0034269403
MAWYPGAVRMELQPESDAQQAIRPTQFIVHSIVGPWTARRTYEYWRDSTNLESHFGVGYAGDIAQYIGTETRADANAAANRRPDGTGAISVETASNLTATDPWTDEQVEELIKAGVWAHERHGIPLRLCRWASDPGFGWHKMHDAWNPSAHSCPGPARIKQFREVVFPGIVARATGKTTTDSEELDMDKEQVFAAVWEQDKGAAPSASPTATTNKFWQPISFLREIYNGVAALRKDVAALRADVAALKKES